MDHDPNHFPTLIAACVIITIAVFILLNVIIFFHERNVKNLQTVIDEMKSTTDELKEEEENELTQYLEGINRT